MYSCHDWAPGYQPHSDTELYALGTEVPISSFENGQNSSDEPCLGEGVTLYVGYFKHHLGPGKRL